MTSAYIVAALLVLSGFLDNLSTLRVLDWRADFPMSVFKELNPAIRWAMDRFGRRWPLFKISLHILAAVIVLIMANTFVTAVGLAASVVVFAVAFCNWRIHLRFKERFAGTNRA